MTIIGTQQDWARFKEWIEEYSQNYTDIAKYICLGTEMRMTYAVLTDYLSKYSSPEHYEVVHSRDMKCGSNGDRHIGLILDNEIVSYEGLVIRVYRGNQLIFTPHLDLPTHILHNLIIPPITLAGIVQHFSRDIVIPSEFMLHFFRLSSILYPHAFTLVSLSVNPLPTL